MLWKNVEQYYLTITKEFHGLFAAKLSGSDTPLVIKVWSKVLCDRTHRLTNLTA